MSQQSELERYDYDLPPELIAQEPLRSRSDARLLVVRRQSGTWEEAHVRDLPQLLSPPDCLVLNDTRVVPARLVGIRDRTGGRWEGLFLAAEPSGLWQVLSKTRGKPEPGETISLLGPDARVPFRLRLISRLEEGTWLVRPDAAGQALELLPLVGRVPLPPYIRGGEMVPADAERYQTVFATRPGAVAAPTAGLHFTPQLLDNLKRHQIGIRYVTLHVGLGTFRPVQVARLADHVMHHEWGEIAEATAEQLRQVRSQGGRIVAGGTTVVRVLETASQQGELRAWSGQTDLFIRPPYTFRSVDALLTNFHLPRSTLLVLVSTLGGEDLIRRAYAYAIRERFRFYSYGDAMLIL